MDREDSVAASRDQDARPQQGSGGAATNYMAMNAGDMLAAIADDASKWADAFGELHPEIDHDVMLGWFANAIENAWDVRCSRLTRNAEALLGFQDQIFAHRRMWAELAETPTEDGSHPAGEPRADAQRRATPDLPQGDA